MFGWFRKRDRDQAEATRVPATAAEAPAPAVEAPVEQQIVAGAAPQRAGHEPGRPEIERGEHELAPAAPSVVLAAPSMRPSMPLSRRANVAGLAEAPELDPPRLLSPTAALGDEARAMLTELLADMFGARGRYRLEWRADREPGDDAMFSDIMVNDLVRRIQNTLAEVAELEGTAELPALEAGDDAVEATEPDDAVEDPADEAERQRAIEAFLAPAETDEQLAAALTPDFGAAAARRIA